MAEDRNSDRGMEKPEGRTDTAKPISLRLRWGVIIFDHFEMDIVVTLIQIVHPDHKVNKPVE